MGDKKGKALALELMDDLLNEDASEIEIEAAPLKTNPAIDLADADSAEIVHDFSVSEHYVEHFPEAETRNETVGADRTEVSNRTEVSDSHQEAPPAMGDEDRTMRIHPSQLASAVNNPAKKSTSKNPPPNLTQPPPSSSPQSGAAEDRVRASVGRFAPYRSSGPASATEAALAQSESLRIAQSRLLEFEQEIERLRLQNEELAAAGETLRRRTDELMASNQKRETDYQYMQSTFEQEKEILVGQKEAVQRDLEALRQKNEELELRISTNIQKIRVRERELENRLELVKMESAALIRSKDEMILELKRNIDQFNLELNNYRGKNQELNRIANDKQEQLRRTVKALRLALSMLEGEEEQKAPPVPQRKAK